MKRIMVVEDDFQMKKDIESKLTRSWFNVTSDNPDLYLFDLWVGWIPMWDRLKALRSDTNALIIIFTWFSLDTYREKALKLWADGYLLKPIVPDDLISYIKNRLW